jgi:hypothetical protein
MFEKPCLQKLDEPVLVWMGLEFREVATSVCVGAGVAIGSGVLAGLGFLGIVAGLGVGLGLLAFFRSLRAGRRPRRTSVRTAATFAVDAGSSCTLNASLPTRVQGKVAALAARDGAHAAKEDRCDAGRERRGGSLRSSENEEPSLALGEGIDKRKRPPSKQEEHLLRPTMGRFPRPAPQRE